MSHPIAKAALFQSRSRLTRLLVGLGLATFIQVLDVSIANVAIPCIANSFSVSANAGIWLITSFTVANGIAILMTGWLARRFGDGLVFLWATFAFCLASLLCGLSWSFESLLFSRCLQGLAAGPILPLSQTLLMRHFPPRERVRALSIWSSIAIAAPIFGPLLGGVIVDRFAWEWIFLINIPVGLLALYLLRDLSERSEPRGASPCFDWYGFAVIVGIVCGLQGLVLADVMKDLVFLCLACGCLLLWKIETQAEAPIVNMALFASGNFSLGIGVIGVGYALYYCGLVLVPLWLQDAKGLSATAVGLASSPIGLLPLLLTPLLARWFERIDKRYWAFLSFFSFALTSLWLWWAAADIDPWSLGGLRFLQGFALAIFYVPLFSMATEGLKEHEIGDASVQITFFRYTLAALAAPLALAFCADRASGDQAIWGAGPHGGPGSLGRIGDFFLVSAGIYFVLACLVFLFGSRRWQRIKSELEAIDAD